jgi:hypothetical protein
VIEAIKLGYGGQAYIRQLFGCHHETLALGMAELDNETATIGQCYLIARQLAKQLDGSTPVHHPNPDDAKTIPHQCGIEAQR